MSLSGLFEISKRSLTTYQKALEVTSNNIANANDPYYSRRTITFGTVDSNARVGMSIGLGVKIEEINRVRDQLSDTQTIKYNQSYSSAGKQSAILSNVEALFGEPDNGLSSMLTDFFNSWDELAVTPNSVPLRTDVVQSAEKVSEKIQNLYEGLNLVKNDLKSDGESLVNEMNSYIKQIQNYNKQIYDANVNGDPGYSLLDKRNEALQNLSQLANINVSYDDKNMASVSIGGVFAIDKVQAIQFKSTIENGKFAVYTEDGNAKVTLTGGELHGISNTYNKLIPDYVSQLDEVANQIFESVNNIHSTGYSNTDPQQTGINFFESYSNGVLKINRDIVDDPNLIAISADGTTGNGDIATLIADLRDTKMSNGYSISENYSNFVSDVANAIVENDQKAEANQLVLQQLDEQQAAYSGVNIDEEMTNIINFQRSYDASAKLISIADELLQTIIDMV